VVRRTVELVASLPPGLAEAPVEDPGASFRGELEHSFGLRVGDGRLPLETEDRADALELLSHHRAQRQSGGGLVVQADDRRTEATGQSVANSRDAVGYRTKRDRLEAARGGQWSQSQRRPSDDAERPFGSDEQLRELRSGGVPRHGQRVDHFARRRHDAERDDQVLDLSVAGRKDA
jgi:hypothetical protein